MSSKHQFEAVVVTEYGPPEVLQVREFSRGEPASGHALVEIAATSVNNVDVQLRAGKLGDHRSLPHAPGPDMVGRVIACAEDEWVGRRVVVNPSVGCGKCRECLAGRQNRCGSFKIQGEDTWGGYSSIVECKTGNLIEVPDDVDTEVAACLPVTFGTAWRMVIGQGQATPDDRVLVIGAGGGIAVAARRIAKLLGADVHVLARPSFKLGQAESEGCTVWPVAADEIDVAHRELRKAGGFSLVVESVGGDWFQAGLRALNPGGRLVTCGSTLAPQAALDLRPVFWKQLSILGVTGGFADDLVAVLETVARGELQPLMHSTLPAQRAADGHRLLESGEVNGKVVLKW